MLSAQYTIAVLVASDTHAPVASLRCRRTHDQSHCASPVQHQLYCAVGAAHVSQPRFAAVHCAACCCPTAHCVHDSLHGRHAVPLVT